MASFTKFKDELLVESKGKFWVLKRAFLFYYLDTTGKIVSLVVPVDFTTDFLSVPRILYLVFPPIGMYNKAAIVHDYLYSKQCQIRVSRLDADKFFLQALEILKVSKPRRLIMYYAVRLFGKKYFKK
jgi:hypothetical protein